MATVTKRDLVLAVSSRSGFTQKQVTTLLQSLVDVISDKITRGESVSLRRFGKFSVKINKPRVGRNPLHPALEIKIPSRPVVRFEAGHEIKQRLAALSRHE